MMKFILPKILIDFECWKWNAEYENKERAAKDIVKDVKPAVTSLMLRAYNHKENHIFNGIEEAVSFIKKKNPAASNETIRKNINKTISNKKQYCSLTWAYI